MKKIKSLGLSLVVISVVGLTGCGGDSGSSSSGNGTSLSFPSNAVSADATLSNGLEVKDVVAQNQQDVYSINAVNTSSSKNIVLSMKKIVDITNEIDTQFYSLNQTVNRTDNCQISGTYNINGSGSETGGASVTLTFNQCEMVDEVVMNGKMLTSSSQYNDTYGGYTSIDIKYLSDITIVSPNINAKIYSGSTQKVNFTNITGYYSSNNMNITLSAISEINTVKSGQQNAIYYFDLSSGQPSMYQTAGKVYINNLDSYVTYDTTYDMSETPFVFSYAGLSDGEARYVMAGGGNVKIVAESNVVKTYVDADGDGIYELSE